MQPQPNASVHSAPGLAEAASQAGIHACSPWSVTALEILSGYRLKVRFHDGLSGIVDMSRLIHSPDAGVFAPLADEALFAQAFITYGAVTWPGESPDLAPDAMHKAIAEQGEWAL